MNILELPPFLRKLIDSPPAARSEIHAWLFNCARNLHAHMPAREIINLLEERVRTCSRYVPRSEISAAVVNSFSCAWKKDIITSNNISAKSLGGSNKVPPKNPQSYRRWPEVNQAQREAIIRTGGGLADL